MRERAAASLRGDSMRSAGRIARFDDRSAATDRLPRLLLGSVTADREGKVWTLDVARHFDLSRRAFDGTGLPRRSWIDKMSPGITLPGCIPPLAWGRSA